MRVMGLDLGLGVSSPSALALVNLDGSALGLELRLSLLAPAADEWTVRVAGLGVAILGHIAELRPELVAYEAPFLGSYRSTKVVAGQEIVRESMNAQTLRQLAALEGAILLACALRGCPVVTVQPVQAKLALAGERYAKKKAMIEAARVLTGVRMPSHEADALGIAMAGEARWRRSRLEAEARES